MNKTTESIAADAILQRTKPIEIDGIKYQVAPPTTATLILVSELVSQLPQINLNAENILSESLMIAKDCRVLGTIAATLILGAKNLSQQIKKHKYKYWGLVTTTTEETIDKQAELADTILKELSPKQLNQIIIKLLAGMEISDFFGFTTSLIEVNLTRATREVGTTASGR